MQETYCVYCHTNRENGKRYVGITKNSVKRRWNCGYKSNEHFCAAIKKYGWDGFNHDVLLDGLTKSEAKCAEMKYIADWNLQDRRYGYNLTAGGESGNSPTDEVRAKMSIAAKSDKRLELLTKAREKAQKVWKGSKHSPETLKKMSDVKIGHIVSEETRAKMSVSRSGKLSWNAGKPWSEEVRKKMSESAKHRKCRSNKV